MFKPERWEPSVPREKGPSSLCASSNLCDKGTHHTLVVAFAAWTQTKHVEMIRWWHCALVTSGPGLYLKREEGTKCHLYENLKSKIGMKGHRNRLLGPDDKNNRNSNNWKAWKHCPNSHVGRYFQIRRPHPGVPTREIPQRRTLEAMSWPHRRVHKTKTTGPSWPCLQSEEIIYARNTS